MKQPTTATAETHCADSMGSALPAHLNSEWLPCTSAIKAQAPLLVFLHGIAGSSASWGAPFRQLNDVADLLLIDCMGFGNSPKPDIAYTTDNHIAALDRTLVWALNQTQNKAGPEVSQAQAGVTDRGRIILIGHSMGALLAAQWALHAADLAGATRARTGIEVILISMPVYSSEQDAIAHVGSQSLFNRWMALETPLARATCWLMCKIRPWLMPAMPRFLPDLPPQVARDSLKHTWRSYSESLRRVVLQSDGPRLLARLSPQLPRWMVIHGLQDPLAPASAMQGALASLAGASHAHNPPRLVWLEGTHDIVFTHAQSLADRIREFVQIPD